MAGSLAITKRAVGTLKISQVLLVQNKAQRR